MEISEKIKREPPGHVGPARWPISGAVDCTLSMADLTVIYCGSRKHLYAILKENSNLDFNENLCACKAYWDAYDPVFLSTNEIFLIQFFLIV